MALASTSQAVCPRPARRQRGRGTVKPVQATSEKQPQAPGTPKKNESDGASFRVSFVGGIPTPQLTSKERQQKMMADLAVVRPRLRVQIAHVRSRCLSRSSDGAQVNSRLAGDPTPSHTVRQKVETIQRQRRTWDLVYEYLSGGQDVTLQTIEAANELVSGFLATCLWSLAPPPGHAGTPLGHRPWIDQGRQRTT